jgi:hypothetical protein
MSATCTEPGHRPVIGSEMSNSMGSTVTSGCPASNSDPSETTGQRRFRSRQPIRSLPAWAPVRAPGSATAQSTPPSASPHPRQPRRAEIGLGDLTGAAGEQRDAELVLELFARRRQRGLGDEEFLRRAAAIQLLAEDDEVRQL